MAEKSKRRTDGRLVKTITDPRTGKRVYFYGATEREISRKILEYQEQRQHGRTFAEVAEEWWGVHVPTIAYKTMRSYKPAKERAVAEFGKRLIKELKPRELEALLKKMARDGLAQKTVKNQRLILNLIFDYAVLEGDIDVNPCSSVSVPRDLKKSPRTAASATDEKIVRESADVWLFPYLALMTGMRRGEILALQWKDIDFENDLIRVTKSIYHEGNRPVVKAPKTEAGYRVIPLLEPLKDTLLAVETRPPEGYIISNDGGASPLSNRQYVNASDMYKKKTGVTCTAHQLRHSFATIAFECGVPVKSVQEILGHKQLSTTMDIYTDFRKKAFSEAVNLLNQAHKTD